MTEADDLRVFTVAVLQDAGAEVRDDGALLWASLPEAAQAALELPGQTCLTLDPERIGEFDAELVAPGSYVLEKLLSFATSRGRWDVSRLAAPDGWEVEALQDASGSGDRDAPEIVGRAERPLALFAFRTVLTSDEKREAFHLLAATLDGTEAWPVPWPLPEVGLSAAALPGFTPDFLPAYAQAREVLSRRMEGDVEGFRRGSLAALEEEVRRVFRYFDGTVAEVREAAPSGAEDVVRAIEAERDGRLAEAVERFEPHAAASLCSVRLVFVPEATALVATEEGGRVEARIDALTRRVRGLPERVTEDEPARPRGRPPWDTPPPRRRDARATARSPRGSKARSRSAASRHPAP